MILKEYSNLMNLMSKKELPLEAYYEISTKCNFNCVHCYNKGKKYSELHERDIIKLIKFIKDSNVFSVILTGGEFFMHQNALKVIEGLYRIGDIEIIVYTNASLITNEIASKLKKYNVKLEVSIYGNSPYTYKKITGDGKNYNKVMKALQILKNYNIEFRLKAIILQENYHELEEIEAFISLYNGVQTYADWALFGHSEEIKQCRLNDHQCLRLYRRQKIEKSQCIKFGNCNAGKVQYCIKPNGDIIPCVGWDNMVIGNIFESNFREISSKFNLSKLINCEIKCDNCAFIDFCNVCPMIFYQDTGSWLQVSNELCRQAKLKKQVYDEQNNTALQL